MAVPSATATFAGHGTPERNLKPVTRRGRRAGAGIDPRSAGGEAPFRLLFLRAPRDWPTSGAVELRRDGGDSGQKVSAHPALDHAGERARLLTLYERQRSASESGKRHGALRVVVRGPGRYAGALGAAGECEMPRSPRASRRSCDAGSSVLRDADRGGDPVVALTRPRYADQIAVIRGGPGRSSSSPPVAPRRAGCC